MEYSWNTNTGASQYGAAIVFNTVNQTGESTWNTTQDTTITNNDIQHFGTEFLDLPGREGVALNGQDGPTYPLNTRMLLANNVYRDWNEQIYDINWGGGAEGGLQTGPGYSDSTHAASGPDYTTMIHNGFYGSPSNKDNFGYLAGAFSLNGECPWSPSYIVVPFPDLTIHANITLADQEFLGDCDQTFDGFNATPGLFINLNWSGNVHVQNGTGTPSDFIPADFTTAGP